MLLIIITILKRILIRVMSPTILQDITITMMNSVIKKVKNIKHIKIMILRRIVIIRNHVIRNNIVTSTIVILVLERLRTSH